MTEKRILTPILVLLLVAIAECRVGSAPSGVRGFDNTPTQYHIQTDEGPERYFRYQTLSGQYRKEKRLEDGTVVGTYGWVDPNGFLRLRDYVADNAGYRILKSKVLFVGKSALEGEKVIQVKEPSAPRQPQDNSLGTTNTNVAVVPARFTSANRPAPVGYGYKNPSVSVVGAHYEPEDTEVNKKPISNDAFLQVLKQRVTVAPSLSPVYATAAPVHSVPSTSLTLPDPPSSSEVESVPYYQSSQNLGPSFLTSAKQLPGSASQSNAVLENYGYDEVSSIPSGFKYFLPRQYHEEHTLSDGQRVGSFGYIDPFGIRRVVEYNAGSGGFVHRKNNRYVGFSATPYDPATF